MSPLRSACAVAALAPMLVASCGSFGESAAPDPSEGGAGDAANDAADTDGDTPATNGCAQGQKACAGGCVPDNLPEYGCATKSCARCSVMFADKIICDGRKCAVGTCQTGHGSCDGDKENGCEADLAVAATCGSCTQACPTTAKLCSSGQCVASCQAGTTECGTQCVDLNTSATNCGMCGVVCPQAPNATGTCVAAVCTLTCSNGFAECDGNPTNGCEPLTPYYKDSDGDGAGAGVVVGEACVVPAGHSPTVGDCLDTNPDVKPGQMTYFQTGYGAEPGGLLSYDYDCNGVESPGPGLGTGKCGPGCNVGDFLPATNRPNPPLNANLHCGSDLKILRCEPTCPSYAAAPALGCR